MQTLGDSKSDQGIDRRVIVRTAAWASPVAVAAAAAPSVAASPQGMLNVTLTLPETVFPGHDFWLDVGVEQIGNVTLPTICAIQIAFPTELVDVSQAGATSPDGIQWELGGTDTFIGFVGPFHSGVQHYRITDLFGTYFSGNHPNTQIATPRVDAPLQLVNAPETDFIQYS